MKTNKMIKLGESRAITLPPRYTEAEKAKIRANLNKKDHQALGPGNYQVKYPPSAPSFQFGSRFGNRVNNKDHIRPQKADGPGPGSYKMPKQY